MNARSTPLIASDSDLPPHPCESVNNSEDRSSGWLKSLPVQANGFALGLSGTAMIFLNLREYTRPGVLRQALMILALISAMCSVVNIAVYTLKFALYTRNTIQTDYSTAAGVSSQVSHVVVPMLVAVFYKISSMTGLENNHASLRVAQFLLYASFLLNIVLIWAFLHYCIKNREPPNPLWFPPVVGVGTLAIAGPAVSANDIVVGISLWSGLVLMLITFPIAAIRMIRNPKVADGPEAAILQAPAAFVFLGWTSTNASPSLSYLTGPKAFSPLLFSLSLLGFIITLYSLQVRKNTIKKEFFSPKFAGFTFPSASMANVALLFTQRSRSVTARVVTVVFSLVILLMILVIVSLWARYVCQGRHVSQGHVYGERTNDGEREFAQGEGAMENVSGHATGEAKRCN
ncbi:hypothetical protein AAMO2058_000291600 [Amorphochlora amoebiformis]